MMCYASPWPHTFSISAVFSCSESNTQGDKLQIQNVNVTLFIPVLNHVWMLWGCSLVLMMQSKKPTWHFISISPLPHPNTVLGFMLVFSLVLKTFRPLGMIQSPVIGTDSSDNVYAIKGFSDTSVFYGDHSSYKFFLV